MLVSVAMFLLFVLVIRIQQRSYVDQATDMVYEIKGETLKSNVREIVQDIERYKQWEAQRDWEQLRSFGTQMSSEEGSLAEIIQSPSGGSWLVNGYRFYVWDEGEQRVVYSSSQLEADSLQEMKELVKKELVVSLQFHKDQQTVICGVNEALVDFRTKQYIYNKIHSLDFADGSCIWVNEVVNYDGGDDYAIRRIYPDPQKSEGTFLSTNTPDEMGNYPDREMLEGVKTQGECYYTDYCRETGSGELAARYIYAYLYRPYHWIICMGSYTSDIEGYRVRLQHHSARIMLTGILAMAVLLAVLIFAVIRLIRKSERVRFGKVKERLEKVSTVDPLTGAVNRRGGEPRLTELLEECRRLGQQNALVMIDIDYFKQINDTYGHETGDRVLSALSAAVKRSFRTGDLLIRWGGDEFLLAVRGMGPEGLELLRTKLYAAVESATVRMGEAEVPVRISSGATVFHPEDENYMDAVNRADRALYQAKRGGKGIMCTNW